jgi:hypothetical protein
MQMDCSSGLERFVRTVFPIIESKDIFMEAYIRLLSRRLLLSDSSGAGRRGVCMDCEKSMVGLMKLQCGTSFTVKVEGMLTDHLLAEDILSKWTETEQRLVDSGGVEQSGSTSENGQQITTKNQRIMVSELFVVCCNVMM